MTTAYRTDDDGSIICQHRDCSCCPDCLAADPTLMDVYGRVFQVDDAERAEIAAKIRRYPDFH